MESRAQLLSRAHSGDRDAVQQMIEENTGLIWSVARRYFGRGVDADDLYQLGCLGFLKAIEGFDERFGTQFSTYAVPKIAGEIRRFLRDDGAVKVSRGLKERAQQIHAARRRLEQTLGREPALSEIAAECGVSVEEIAEAETAAAPAESLQRESGDEGFTLEHVLGDYGQEDRVLESVALRTAIERLPEKEQQVINLRFFPRPDAKRLRADPLRIAGTGIAPRTPGNGKSARRYALSCAARMHAAGSARPQRRVSAAAARHIAPVHAETIRTALRLPQSA